MRCPERPGAIDFSLASSAVRCQWVIWEGSGKVCTWCGEAFRDWSCGVMMQDRERFAAWCMACTLSWAADTDARLREQLVEEFLGFVQEAVVQRRADDV